MSNMKYESELYILTKEYGYINKVINADKPTERINIPVHSFEVDGGANRKINFTSTDEMTILSEFEQARAFTNFIFYVPPTMDFLAVRLMSLEKKEEFFEIDFIVSVYSKGRKIQTLRLSSDEVFFRETPIYIGGTPTLLMIKVHLARPKLLYGHFDPRRRKIVHKQI